MENFDLNKWLENNNIPSNLVDKKDLYITEEDGYKLNFSIYNNKGEINVFKIPVDKNGEILDPIYNLNLDKKSNQKYIEISQLDENNGMGIGLSSLKLKPNDKNVFFTLSPLDRLFIVSLGERNVVSIPPNVFSNYEETTFFEELNKKIDFKEVEKFYLCFPKLNNKAELEEKFAERLDKNKVLKMDVNSINDYIDFEPMSFFELFKLFPENVEERKLLPEFVLKTFVEESQAFPVSGIYQLSDFESKIDSIYKNGMLKGERTGWNVLDSLYRPKTKHITVVYGIPQSGKSLFVKNLCLNLAKTAKWKSAFFSFEDESPDFFYHEMIEKYLGELTPFHGLSKRTKESLKEDKYLKAKQFVQNNIKLILPNEDMYGDETFFDGLLDLFEKAVSIYGVKNIVLDPWNQIFQGKPTHLSEAEFLSICLGKVNRFAQKNDVHVIIVAHPKIMPKEDNGDYKVPTLYDLSGGSQWFNKISAGICVYRRTSQIDNGLDKILHIYIQKRKNRSIGVLGSTFLVTGINNETLYGGVNVEKYTTYLNGRREEKVQLKDFLTIKKGLEPTQDNVVNITDIADHFLVPNSKGKGSGNKNNESVLPFKGF